MGRLRAAAGIGVVDADDTVYLAPIPWGPIVVLDGVAPFIWSAALDRERTDVPGIVAEATGAELAEIRDQVDGFLAELLERGLLVEDVV